MDTTTTVTLLHIRQYGYLLPQLLRTQPGKRLVMATKLYYQSELTDKWKEGLEASIKVGKLRNHREKTTQRNDRDLALWVALDFQDMGIMSPETLQEESWLELVNRYRNAQTRSKNKITEKSIKKRREGLIQLLEGLGMQEHLKSVRIWQPKKEDTSIRYWSEDEMEAMKKSAFDIIQNSTNPERGIIHLLMTTIAPRRSDAAEFKWEYIDFNQRLITFKAKKNGAICTSMIQESFIPILMDYKEEVSKSAGGDIYLFPSSRAQTSGTAKTYREHVSDKTIVSWLKEISQNSSLRDGTPVQDLNIHCYRHTLAMKYVNKGEPIQRLCTILGDTIATIETYYSERVFTFEDKKAFHRVNKNSRRESSEGTSQPDFLTRDKSLLEPITDRGMDSLRWTLGDLNPRPPRCKRGALPS
jgi:site-specific recombinase XerD